MPAKLCAPIDVQIEVTQQCTQRCSHCYNFWWPIDTANKLKRLNYDSIKHIVKELKINQIPAITITGGEPFIARQTTMELVTRAREIGTHISINSNFSLVDDDVIKFLVKHKNITMLASLLSDQPSEHERITGSPVGTFNKVIRNIKKTIASGISVGINMVIRKDNMTAITGLAKLAKKVGARSFCATKVLPNINNPDNSFLLSNDEIITYLQNLVTIEETLNIPVDILGCYPKCLLMGTKFYSRFYHRICVAGCTTATIGADGEVRPCSHMSLSYGNIFNEPFKTIWNKMSAWGTGKYIPSGCQSCILKDSCRGGCRVNNLKADLNTMDENAIPEHMLNITKEDMRPVKQDYKISIPEELTVHPHTKFRDEAFGSVIYRDDYFTILLINKSATDFLKYALNNNITLTFTMFLKHSGAAMQADEQKVKNLYKKLYRKKILIKQKSEGGDNNGSPTK
ncbi:MAG: radical SAM protein [Patescibacteria group bacterium]